MRYGLLIGLAVLCLTTVAQATVTYSPPVRSSEGDNLGCRLLNLSSADVTVTAELENGLGTIVDTTSLSVPAGQARLLASANSAIFGGYCRFTFDGDVSQVRGYISLEDAGGSNTRLLYAAEPVAGTPPTGITTYSPPVRSSEGDNLGCQLLNLGAAPVTVSAQLHDGLGGVVDTQSLTIPAGEGRLLARSSNPIFGGYCGFTFEGDPTAVRGYITLEDAGGSNTRLLFPADPALAAPEPTATATADDPAATATPTPPPSMGCCGDCNGDGEVAINELITAVNNALVGCMP